MMRAERGGHNQPDFSQWVGRTMDSRDEILEVRVSRMDVSVGRNNYAVEV